MARDDAQFESEIQEIEKQIEALSIAADPAKKPELDKLIARRDGLRREIFEHLNPWQKTLVARNAQRPYTLDYIRHLMTDFVEIHGDRRFGDDPAIVGGFAMFRGLPVVVIGHEKGRDTKEKILRNFGMPKPEGYRKALRLFKLAEKFKKPVICLIDTPGAYPGIGAEERGQAEAIALNLREMARLRVPILVTITGEGGSGGALALGVGDYVNMLEFSVYSVISPEGCAAILWKDQAKVKEAAAAMKITAPDLKALNLIDEIIQEPLGGAHVDPAEAAKRLGEVLWKQWESLKDMKADALVERRYQKFRAMGFFEAA
jgi:acetyl-CoA carboxylase carboxyl transferase subunit alpha